MKQTELNVVQIPQEYCEASSLDSVGKSFRQLRLQALDNDPASFSSSYGTESQQPLSFWTSRILNRQAKTFALVYTDQHAEAGQEINFTPGDLWLGMLVLLGPAVVDACVYDNFSTWKTVLMEKSSRDNEACVIDVTGNRGPENSALAYHIVSVYVAPEVREKGFAKRLVGSALNTIVQVMKEKEFRMAICTVGAAEGAVAAHKTYEGMGFVKVADDNYTSDDGRKFHNSVMRRDLTL
jgi:GNAT superfamily N-acetyltransferase